MNPVAAPSLSDRDRTRQAPPPSAACDDGAVAGMPMLVHELFERTAARFPDAAAVEAETRRLTYAELDACAGRLARVLRRRGVEPDVLVGVHATRSVDIAIAVLAVLKAGAAYVPLDTGDPDERMRIVVEDARPAAILCDEGTESRVRALAPTIVIARHAYDGEILASDTPACHPDQLAYVLFTSGSTGRPKGVAMPHAPLVNLLRWSTRREQEMPPRTLQFASLGFDVSFHEMFSSWTRAGTVVIAPEDARRDPIALARLLEAARITHLFVTPAMLAELAMHPSLVARTGVKEILVTGERFQVTRGVEELIAALPGVIVENQYGPSETHVVTAFELPTSTAPETHPPIGHAISNARVVILNDDLTPVPAGAAGELYIGGPVLARGYWNRPDLTAERFIPSLDPQLPGSRWYRSGDVARARPGGDIDFIGRRDGQVKVRGHRVELGEIEAALGRDPSVAQAVVLLREDGRGESVLVAYLRKAASAIPNTEQVRRRLIQLLPAHMVPASFVWMDAFPASATGKVDRRRLPVPAAAAATAPVSVRGPEETVAQLVSAAWTAVLGRPTCEPHDDFFECGGHSLAAARLVHRVRETFGVNVPLRAFLDTPTPAGLEMAVRLELLQAKPQQTAICQTSDRTPPLSFAQQRFWILQQTAPESPAYNLCSAFRIAGALRVDVLSDSFSAVAARQDILRTVIAQGPSGCTQRVLAWHPSCLPAVDCRAAGADAFELAMRVARADASRPFDLAAAPAWRAFVALLGRDDALLVVVAHHILLDESSLELWCREVSEEYASRLSDTPAEPSPLLLRYGDFAAWQRAKLDGSALPDGVAWWGGHLDGAEAASWPIAAPSAGPHRRGSVLSRELPATAVETIVLLGRQEGVTPFMALMTVFLALLHRLSGQTDLLIGTPVATRIAEAEDVIGPFLNTLTIRSTLARDSSFRRALRDVRKTLLDALIHQDVPFEAVADAVRSARGERGDGALFRIVFSTRRAVDVLRLEGTSVTAIPVASGGAKYDLEAQIVETGGTWMLAVEHAVDVMTTAEADRFADRFVRFLDLFARAADEPVGELALMSEAESAQVRELASGAPAPDAESTVIELIAAQIARTPHAIAVRDATGDRTYAALADDMARMAQYLRTQGVAVEDRVAICAERSIDMLTAILGIMQAGAAYVPLDPGWPAARLESILADVEPRLVITDSDLGVVLGASGTPVLDLRVERAAIARQQPVARSPVDPDNLVYVIYTSGSTGAPKGAANTHRAVANRLVWMQREYGLQAFDRVLQKTPITFDVAAWELFWPLMTGAELVLARHDGHRDAAYLTEVIRSERISVVHFIPSLLDVWLADPRAAACRSLRYVFVSGEALPRMLADRFRATFGDRLHNLYGPTEAAIDVTYWHCSDRSSSSAIAPIGRPVTATRVAVMDGCCHVQPVGTVGEICIGGRALARGYWNRPALTAERFVPDPSPSHPGERLYRTGDRGWYAADGLLEYSGREDAQVKIRGVRIEIEEIETLLRRHPAVRDAAVSVIDLGSTRQLAAYLVVGDQSVTVGEIQRHVAAQLPHTSVPARILTTSALPRTSSGKLDRKHLSAVVADPLAGSTDASEAQSPFERTLARIWCEVLNVDAVGVNDDFFRLGGDSILALLVIARAADQGLDLSVTQLFQRPTIRALSAVASAVASAPAAQSEPGPLELWPMHRWWLEHLGEPASHWNQAVLLVPAASLSDETIAAAWQRVAARHDALRLRLVRETDRWTIEIAPVGEASRLSIVDLRGLIDEQNARALRDVKADAQASLDLTTGPVVRAILVADGAPSGRRLLLAAHHLCVDGVSWRILVDELTAACQDRPLPPAPPSLHDWQTTVDESAAVSGDALDWWQSDEWTTTERIPVDLDAGPNDVRSSEKVRVELTAEETTRLLQEGHVPSSLTATLVIAVGNALTTLFDSRAIVVDVERHGREEIRPGIDASRSVGWFTTISPVLVRARAGNQHVREQLERSRGGLDYLRLRYLSRSPEVSAAMRRVPRADVVVNYLGQFARDGQGASAFRPIQEDLGPLQAPDLRRSHLIEVLAYLVDGRLVAELMYSRHKHLRESLQRAASLLLSELRDCAVPEAPPPASSRAALAVPTSLDTSTAARLLDRDDVEDVYGLTPLQEGMLFHCIAAPSPGVYVGQLELSLEGTDVEALRAAWLRAVERHTALRTAFIWESVGWPQQAVCRTVPGAWHELDWRAVPVVEQETRFARLAETETCSIDLRVPPLVRWMLIRVADARWRALLTHHHLVLDGWSIALLFDEMLSTYGDMRRDAVSPLVPAPPYRDVVESYGRTDVSASKSYWRARLAGLDGPTSLAAPGPRSDGGAPRQRRRLSLSAAATAKVVAVARAGDITPTAIACAAYARALGRRIRTSDVVFGLTVSGRRADVRGAQLVVGNCINTVPVRVQVDDRPLADSAAIVHRDLAGLFQHDRVPLVSIHEWSGLPPRSELFDSILVVQNFPVAASLEEKGRIAGMRVVSDAMRTHYALMVTLTIGSELGVDALFDDRRVTAEAAEWVLDEFCDVLSRPTALAAVTPA